MVASGFRHAHHGPKIWQWSRAEGKAAWPDKALQLLLASNREPSEEVALNAARGIVISKEGRGGRWPNILRLLQGDGEFRKRWLISFPEHL